MVGAIVLSPTDAASQEAVVGSAQRVVVARLLAGLLEAASCVAYAPVNLDGQVVIVVDFPPEVSLSCTQKSASHAGPH